MSSFTASVDLPPVIGSIATARHLLVALLHAWEAPHDIDDAALLVAELAANAVDHVPGEAAFTVEVTLSDGWLRVSVADGSALQPMVLELSTQRPRGRGLALVRGFADRWGSEPYRGGKRVWFELRPPGL